MKKKIIISCAFLFSAFAFSQVGIGTANPHQNAILELSSTNKGFLPPRLTTAQRDAINPKPAALMIYNTDTNCMQYWNNSVWDGWDCTPTAASVATLDCSPNSYYLSPSTSTVGVPYTGTFTVNYTGGNGQPYPASTPETTSKGLTFTRRAGTLNNGSGTIIYDVSGTPTSEGYSNFTATFNGATSSCDKTLQINPSGPAVASVTGLDCSGNGGYLSPSQVTGGQSYVGTFTVNYTGGNGVSYPAGDTLTAYGLTAVRRAGTLNNGSGTIIYDVTGTAPTFSFSPAVIVFRPTFNGAPSSCDKELIIK